ncbi:hypothetical protein RB653_008388 [Dictyostelium firmibasis]|uniref:Uncharacterized protein n=1 Tax=Dictyostelium firmibasis TaxID=79012 RepID=A0AAN7U4P0_9MYCE
MSALGRNLGNFIQTFSNQTSSLKTINGLKRGLLPCCGSTIRPMANNHHHSQLINVNRSSISGIRTELFNSKGLITQFQVRQYCSESKLQVSPTPKVLLANICTNEIDDFKRVFQDNNSEADLFLEESGFELSKDGDQAVLKKTFADGTHITIRFDSLEQPEEELNEELNQNEHDEEEEAEQEEEEEEEEVEEDENNEEDENEEGEAGEEAEEGNEESHDHPFQIEITPKDNANGKLTFGCYASHDGNYTISGFYKGGFGEFINPVDIDGTTPEFQDNILLVLQQYGVDERLSFFIHDYVHNKKINDYLESFEALKEFVSKE